MNARLPYGVFAASLRDTRLDPATALKLAEDFAALMYGSIFDLSPTLDLSEIAEWRERCAAGGVAAHAHMLNLHPFRVGQDRRLLRAGDGDALRGLDKVLAASAVLGQRDLITIIGRIEDRFDRLSPWPDQLAATAALLRGIAPLLREHGLRLALKTHEEISTFEVLRLLDAAGPDVVSIAFDPVNVLVTMEDPVLAAQRVAANVSHVLIDDAELDLTGGTAHRLLCPLGEGLLDWPALTSVIAGEPVYWLELHRGQFGIRPFDPGWLSAHPDLDPVELARVQNLIVHSGQRLADRDRRAVLAAAQARPTTRLPEAVAACRSMLTGVGAGRSHVYPEKGLST